MLSDDTEDWIRRHGLKLIAVAAIVVGLRYAYGWWICPPAVEFDNLRYVQLLSTAISSQNNEWLRKVQEAVRHRHQAGEMSDRERQAFEGILATATDGDWKQAERDCFRLAEAQLSRNRVRPAAANHQHDHDHSPSRELTRTP